MGAQMKDQLDDSTTWLLGGAIEFYCFAGWL
jgi:hypothetical protein